MHLRTGPFTTRISSRVASVTAAIRTLYEGFPCAEDGDFADFHITLARPKGVRRWLRPQITFEIDGFRQNEFFPLDQALPTFEWGLNWCISTTAHQYLLIHAAAIERDGRVAIMPGVPGAGKSTLTAGLVNRGWRLLSDELTLLSFGDGRVWPLARPISLKNESIEVIRRFVPGAIISDEAKDTVKGTVALLRAPADSIARVAEPACPAWIVFPSYLNGLPAEIRRSSKASAFMRLGRNAFNYSIHGARGFELLARVVDACDCYTFTYADLNEAVDVFDYLKPPH